MATRPRVKTGFSVLALSIVVLLLTGRRLDRAPLFLTQDEAFFGITAHSIASTARDTSGHFLPLYFQWPPAISTNIWFQPTLIYVTALFLKVLPLSAVSVRLPTVIVGLLDVVL